MQSPDIKSIEAALSRLMPPALSQGCLEDIETMIDELAGPEPEKVASLSSHRWSIGFGIAAAITALCAISPISKVSPEPPLAAIPLPGFVLVSESERVQSVTDEGWQEYPDGSAMHAVSFSAVEESKVLDEETGMIVQISVPREEIVFNPINSF
jgi:hypothetical protein